MRVIGLVRTTEDLGESLREVAVAVTPQWDDKVGEFLASAMETAVGEYWETSSYRRDAIRAVIELRIEFEPGDNKTIHNEVPF
ncbi:MAG: hypothetical protein LBK42_02030 [Propionibacteriaceae bacterium]|nr:hypothetical protein [Propionibacteriaceae bacterium]